MHVMSGDLDILARAAGETPDPVGVLHAGERLWEALDEADKGRFLDAPKSATRLAWFLSASPGLAPFMIRQPECVVRLFLEGGVERFGLRDEEKEAFWAQCRQRSHIKSLARWIARFRNTHLIRLYCQEILGLRSPSEIWTDWADVAACCLQGALEGCRAGLPDHGRGVELAVIGMGKLGAAELNFASDIDLIYLYDHTEDLDPVRAHEWAVQWATRLTATLEKGSEEGPAFRVDLDLRPAGKDGAVVQTLDAAELYYQIQAAAWERLALIKARPVAGDAKLGTAFVEMVRPFVFRKYLDYGSLEDIRAIKERMQQEVRWRSPGPVDVKLGRGGIREVEFLVQTLQLVYGGRIPALRTRGTLETMEALKRAQLIETKEYDVLRGAYLFLRGVEHRVQMVQHRQTQRLPVNERERNRIAGLMGYGGPGAVEAFMKDLDEHMEAAHNAFEGLLEAPSKETVSKADGHVQEIFVHLEDEETATNLLKQVGFRQPQAARESVRRIMGGRLPAHRSPKARRILQRLFPRTLPLILRTPVPDQTLFRLERFWEAVGPRGGYYALLEENPETLEHLISLFGQSALLARWLSSHLDAIDALIDRGHHRPRRGKEELLQEAEGALGESKDQEERLGRLRMLRAQEILRIGVADLWGVLSPTEVGEELTRVAEVFLHITFQEALRAVAHDLGAKRFPFCVLGLGSLGGRELSYRSDLDIIFVYEDPKATATPRSTSTVEQLTKVGQRLISWMTVPMREGPSWPVDLRLRPSGSMGPLMVSLDSFRRYHEEQGRTWERQSLLKARFCSGDEETGLRAMDVVDRVLTEAPAPDPESLHAMRTRMERERGARDLHGQIHLKMGPGGMADLEFLIQYYQMLRWAEDPTLRSFNTREALLRLVETGLVGQEEGRFLDEAYVLFKGIENRLGLILDHKGTDRPCTLEDIEALGLMDGLSWIPTPSLGEGIPELILRVMGGVREIYLRHLAG